MEPKNVVLLKSNCLHEKSFVSYYKKLETVSESTHIIIEEVERWQSILSVNYANYNLEKDNTL